MAFSLDKVVPWGRSYDEYRAMFTLSEADLRGRILGVGDGPASFNAEFSARGGRCVSIDPLYHFSADEIRDRIEETRNTVLAQTRENVHEFVWNEHIPNADALGRIRMAAMRRFLTDYTSGAREGRYVAGALPDLPFVDDAFYLAICSHFLFLYAEQFDAAWHVTAIEAMLRVAREVRIFPLLELGSVMSRHREPVIAILRSRGRAADVLRVGYEFQRGGNEMLVVRRK